MIKSKLVLSMGVTRLKVKGQYQRVEVFPGT